MTYYASFTQNIKMINNLIEKLFRPDGIRLRGETSAFGLEA